VIDTATLSQITSIPVGDQPTGVIVSKDGSRVYVASGASNAPTFSVIDVASNTVIATFPQIGPALGFTIFH
jgi:YVTN family beta-propeller protein